MEPSSARWASCTATRSSRSPGNGRAIRGDDSSVHEALSDHVGRPVTLGREERVSHFDKARCVMLDLATDELRADRGLLRTVTELNAGDLGVVADVVSPGLVSAGDAVSLLADQRRPPAGA